MPQRRILITGFGAFGEVQRNPSREVAFALAARGLGAGGRVDAVELPVVFSGVEAGIDAALAKLASPPDFLLGLGALSKLSACAFRLERRARGVFDPTRVDNSGATGAALDLGPERRTELDLERLASAMEAAGSGPVLRSEDAGRYVCERTYLHLLARAENLGAQALFLHLPRLEVVDLERQIAVVGALAAELLVPR